MVSTRKALLLLPAVAALAALATIWAPTGGAASIPGCPSFASQAAAQTYFVAQGGSPGHQLGRLDPDHDGVACEGLGAPYQGFARIAYNKKRAFFYGVASMPPLTSGKEGFACLKGNRYDPEAARLLRIYRVRSSGDIAVLGTRTRPAEPRPDSGRLVWKAETSLPGPGRYYVAFEAALRTSPYGPTPCPEFRSGTVRLP
jgi:hypothetical protein